MSRPTGVAQPEGVPLFFTRALGDNDFLGGHAYYIPFKIKPPAKKPKNHQTNQHLLLPQIESSPASQAANLSENARNYTTTLGLQEKSGAADPSRSLWMHALATGYSSAYLTENPDGIRQDWPRIPLPDSKKALLASAELGQQIAVLLDTESPMKGVTSGDLRPELKPIGVPSHAGGGSLKESELALTAGWGHAGKGGVTMPGKGKLFERDYSKPEREAMYSGGRSLALSAEKMFLLLGSKTFDVYLNDVAYWANVPAKVWDYTIGGYQVIKKWLSYREEKLIGRPLNKDEVRYVQEMVRRTAAILLLGPSLNASYRTVKANAFPWTSIIP